MERRTQFSSGSPAPSRPTTPLVNRYKQHLDHLTGDFNVSTSRARPERKFSGHVESGGNTRSQSRRTRFASQSENASPERVGTKEAALHSGHTEGGTWHSPDPLGDELAENARIWHIYNAEATKVDTTMTEGCNRSIDVLLVFTGLFSAVLTTFIIQSYQLMIPDPSDTTNTLLTQLILAQSNLTLEDINTAVSVASTDALPSLRQIHWVNGLWFAALACSLSTALISMLAKQWLQAYVPNISGSPRLRARKRQARYLQLKDWHVPAIINALPLMLHVALLLFFAGLIVLLWSADLGITLATWVIVALVYCFYLASIWLPLVYPECPYHHPLSDNINKWLHPKQARQAARVSAPSTIQDTVNDHSGPVWKTAEELHADFLDASALIWLLNKSPDRKVVAAAAQSIAGLPRDFTAVGALRDAGAMNVVERGFESCFHKDTAVDLQWHLLDPEGAELYCRAWIKLTRQTNEKWPIEIIEPLWALQEYTVYPDVVAVAFCAIALSAFDSRQSQWELLEYLNKCTTGEVQLAQTTQCFVLDSIIECTARWEMPALVIEETKSRAVPPLLRLLQPNEGLLTEDLRMEIGKASNVRQAAALALFVLTQTDSDLIEPFDPTEYQSDEQRRAAYCHVLLGGLAHIIDHADQLGLKEELLDTAAKQLSRLAASVVAQSERFPPKLKGLAKQSLLKLYVNRRIGVGLISDKQLANVLRLLFPPLLVPEHQRPVFVTILLETLQKSNDEGVVMWSVRLLEILLLHCDLPVSQAFADNNGINIVLQVLLVAKAGDESNRRLQIDSLRALCAYIDSTVTLYKQCTGCTVSGSQINSIFRDEFFDVLCSVVASRQRWLFEVSGHWMPALVHLCEIRPNEEVWNTVVTVFRKFVERTVGEEGYMETQAHLDHIVKMTSPENSETLSSPSLETNEASKETLSSSVRL